MSRLQKLLSLGWVKVLNLLISKSSWTTAAVREICAGSLRSSRVTYELPVTLHTKKVALWQVQLHFWRVSLNWCAELGTASKMDWLNSMRRIVPAIFVTHSWFHIECFYLKKKREGKSPFTLSWFLLLIAVSAKCIGTKCFWCWPSQVRGMVAV